MAGLGDIIGGLFGEEKMARQFFVWSVASAVIQELMGPYLTAMGNAMNAISPEKPLSPAELADMVVRGIINQNDGAGTAKKSGVSEFDFDLMVKDTGEPPSALDMLMLYRRGKVDRPTVEKAIRQSRVRDEWIDTIFLLGIQPPTPADIINSTLKGQIDENAGHDLFVKLGGDPEYFQLMVDTVGDAPSPDQAASMARRGIIPWDGSGPDVVSYEQAVKEGHWRNKWAGPYRDSAQYTPPPRTITAMHSAGSLSDAEATAWLHKAGVPDALVPNFLKDASATKTGKAKDLAVSTIQTLFMAHAIGESEAVGFLGQLKYNDTDAKFVILSWTMARELTARNTAVTTVHASYTGHKIDRNMASNTLDRIGIPSDQRDYLLSTWDEERAAKVSVLTAAEIKKAMNASLIDPGDALNRLINMGYSQGDAEIYLQL